MNYRKILCTGASLFLLGCDSGGSPDPIDPEPDVDLSGCADVRETNHSLLFTGAALTPLAQGDVLYVFSPDAVCAGASDAFSGKNFSIAAWGDDSMTDEKDGLAAGESFVFYLKSSRYEDLLQLHPTELDGPSTYQPQGITIIKNMAQE